MGARMWVACLVLLGPVSAASSGDELSAQSDADRIAALEKRVVWLAAENAQLKSENGRLRRKVDALEAEKAATADKQAEEAKVKAKEAESKPTMSDRKVRKWLHVRAMQIERGPRTTLLTGNAYNDTSANANWVRLEFRFYDENGTLLGMRDLGVSDIKPKSPKRFSMDVSSIGPNIAGVKIVCPEYELE